jgi:transketolase N-terminal domain/subunit
VALSLRVLLASLLDASLFEASLALAGTLKANTNAKAAVTAAKTVPCLEIMASSLGKGMPVDDGINLSPQPYFTPHCLRLPD